MVQFLIGLFLGIGVTVFAIALTTVDDDERGNK